MLFYSKAENKSCVLLIDRLKKYISLKDACNYIGIQVIDLVKISSIESSYEFKPEKERDLQYHLQKIKHFIEAGVEKPLDIDCLCLHGKILPVPVILDGRHRYIAALLRRDITILATYSGRQDLLDYLTDTSNILPRE